MKTVTIATRGSKLALWQANHIADALRKQHGGKIEVGLEIIKTTGDKIQDVPLAKVGGKGLFVKEIEEALLDGRADLAVHSMKDVPAELPAGLALGVIPLREEPTDTLLSIRYDSLDEMPAGAVIGTSSLRRQAQTLRLRPDLHIRMLRGNVDTRLRKLKDGEYDAIIMATAGLNRLGLSAPKSETLAPPRFLPAVGQGALGLEFRETDPEIRELTAFLHHAETAAAVEAERGFLLGLEGGCQVPIAAFAQVDGDSVRLTGMVAEENGRTSIVREIEGPVKDAYELGLGLAQTILDAGGKAILEQVYGRAL